MRRLFLIALCVLTLHAQQKKILVADDDGALAKDLQSVTAQAKIVPVNEANTLQEIVDAEAYIGNISSAEVRAGKNLKWVGAMSAGVENLLFPKDGSSDLRDSSITLTNNKIVQGPEIADHALAMLLMLSRNLYALYRNDQQEIWNPGSFHGIELNGKTAVVVGVGGIGTQIAVRDNAFGTTVIGVDPQDKPFLPFLKSVIKPDQLDDVLPQADVVFVSVPDTPKSHKMMGAYQFELMKKNSYFIAVSRGGIYDMNGLVKALDEKRLAGAGVDVTDPEPLPKGHPLWKFPNVVITPHIAGRSDQDAECMVGTIKENIRRFVEDPRWSPQIRPMVVTSKPANRNQSGQGSYSALRRAPASIIFWGSYFSVRGYGRLTLPGRRIRQRWEATGAPAQRLTGPGGRHTTRLLHLLAGRR